MKSKSGLNIGRNANTPPASGRVPHRANRPRLPEPMPYNRAYLLGRGQYGGGLAAKLPLNPRSGL